MSVCVCVRVHVHARARVRMCGSVGVGVRRVDACCEAAWMRACMRVGVHKRFLPRLRLDVSI